MKVLVVSDVHTNLSPLLTVLGKLSDLDGSVFLGDGYDLAVPLLRRRLPFCYAVQGNVDGYGYGDEDGGQLVKIEGLRIFLTHGHKEQVKFGYQRVVYAAQEQEANLCLFGHTHLSALFYEQGIMFLNPGSIGHPRLDGVPSLALLDFVAGEAHPTLLGIIDGVIQPLPPAMYR